ncbi:MAG TPA: hypothetical protein VK833_03010 [Gillisia sp.]|nr:hypothetical protein [Gillisia sp.]
MWVSANPYQLGAFVAYDLDEAFKIFENGDNYKSVMTASETIPADNFIHSQKFRNHEEFRVLSRELNQNLADKETVSDEELKRLIHLNPNYWKAYAFAGNYYFDKKEYKKAIIYFKQARKREVTTLPDRNYLDKMIAKCYKKL